MSNESCLTCYGSGEVVTEFGPEACPDCAGAPGEVGEWQQTERRIRDIEQRHAGAPAVDADLKWLLHELRRSRKALLQILSRCQDAGPSDELATEVRFYVQEATGMYRPARTPPES